MVGPVTTTPTENVVPSKAETEVVQVVPALVQPCELLNVAMLFCRVVAKAVPSVLMMVVGPTLPWIGCERKKRL